MTAKTWVVYITCPNREEGERLATGLVTERLAACVNLMPEMMSIYWWEGAIQKEPEVLLIVKTPQARFEALADYVKSHHSYTTPEIIALPVEAGHPEYLAWVSQSCG